MAINLVQIKVELESDSESDEIVKNCDNEAELRVPSMEPVFVSIKEEIPTERFERLDPEESTEPDSTTPDDVVPEDVVPEEFHITVKQEPLEHVEAVLDESCSADCSVHPEPHSSKTDFDVDSMIDVSLEGKYQCKLCAKVLANKYNAQRHVAAHKKTQGYCEYCNEQVLDLQKHIRTDHMQKYECNQCGKLFNSSSNLHQHQKVHLTEKPFACEMCNKQFTTKANMMKHRGKSRCRVTGPLVCNVCQKVFKSTHLLKSHLTKHSTERPYECNCCGMTFKHKSTIIRHLQLHNTEKQYPCKICGKRFSSPGLIKPHMRMHTGEKPYLCPVCNKTFSHKHNMQRHSMLHNKIVHLVCEICNKKFPRESRLKYHMRTHMPNRPDKLPFKCEHCYKRYSHRQNIMRHYKKKHPGKTYSQTETDASIAAKIWERVLKQKLEEKTNFILPVDIDEAKIKNEIL